MKKINIIGGGLAGSEAALQLAAKNWQVELFEMRPAKQTEVHQTASFAEIVCSNSLKSKLLTTASGLLKAEMELLGCKLLPIAETYQVPAGNALAVDRNLFAKNVTKIINDHPNINVHREEVTKLDDELTIIATGPLTTLEITAELNDIIGEEFLYFFDAIAPIVTLDSINDEIVYRKTRYDRGEPDYLNCPLSKDQYYEFIKAVNVAEKHEVHEFESKFFTELDFNFYENCTPIEELARRGKETLRYGVMKPVGLDDPRTGKWPFAVVQLRAENKDQTAYNLVGCQTMLKYHEQKKIFRLIPGLAKAEFLRFGSVHRNTYLHGPNILNKDMSLKKRSNIYIAGQLAGVEGYVESIFSGLLVANILSDEIVKIEELLPETTISGQLWRYLLTPNKNFQPMNANFGLLPMLSEKVRDKKLRKKLYSERALRDLRNSISQVIL
ncbi:MAG: methylenetetrahydrofolate--tRNA-(uracil(54)-C(5))-methyltransferase (FADH(2)-oxidizing) TrmFO [Candidatus Cloacimonetes bacterium]|nr:methylenetetrahydrofolate--tRNA-(uracil(54)-C(5))-methyltransferase (FADH(2)-oxidizing) TrmFO [Candidatus Cloacimonadota bacterium]